MRLWFWACCWGIVLSVRASSGETAGAGPELPPVPDAGLADKTKTRPPASDLRFAAEVGQGKIRVDQVFEVWGPAWYESMAKVRRGELPEDACDERLQKEWERALETVIREEVFYQEAVRTHEERLAQYIDQVYAQQQSRRRPGETGPSRKAVARAVRDRERRHIARAVNDLLDRYLRASGGVARLKKMLTERGLTWDKWRERLQKKGFVNRHLHMVLGPLVSRHVAPRDVRTMYREHKQDFVKPGRVVFRHILFSYEARGGEAAARVAARNVYDAIAMKRITFEAAARKHSDDLVSRARGGLEEDLAEDPEREAWLAEIRQAVRKEKPGALGPILVSGKGCHLIELIRAEPGTPIPFREAQREIRERIYAERWEAATDKYYDELKELVRIQVLMPAFPQELSWAARAEQKRPPIVPLGPGSVPSVEQDEATPAE